MFRLISHFEHFEGKVDIQLPFLNSEVYKYDFLKKKGDQNCFTIEKDQLGHRCKLSYFVGVDWIVENETALYVAPKLDKESGQTDYLKMLFSALKHPDIAQHTEELFEVKFDSPFIEISQQQDLLTPLLVVQFLRIVKEITRKGLRKSYYKVSNNLQAKVKGKVMVGQTVKHNILKNRPLHTFCMYDEFGVNGLENRLLKRALIFINRYLPSLSISHTDKYSLDMLNYIMPAFVSVSDEVNLSEIKQSHISAFYKEYTQAISLAKLILKRFGYNINNTDRSEKIRTPPFWIDMSKLFELYVLGLLKDRFPKVSTINYQFGNRGNKLDFLLNSDDYKMVVDAKYKIRYTSKVDHLDIRQVSGYARLRKVYDFLGVSKDKVIDCLIIYPDQKNGSSDLFTDLRRNEINEYYGVFKVGIKLPMQSDMVRNF
ncbi:5-methylcytosine restriction system specificity protein McrC [Dyadobacter frigoris]|uniref:Restriction endonuclease n=1 Tax=Dyadobacter frigoris TaxID=2576211 RepID=A0A4U6D5B8_9BACT|nr:hypothetical protein [Dyadobacter frigoris]TKT91397.1 hypothetical protein FDK13_13545 [Dyadobacter frigoris]